MTAALRLLRAGYCLRRRLAGLHVCKATSFCVDVQYLLLTLLVERADTLARGSIDGFFEVGIETGPGACTLVAYAVLLVDILRLVRRLVLCVKLLEGGCEAGGEAMLISKPR